VAESEVLADMDRLGVQGADEDLADEVLRALLGAVSVNGRTSTASTCSSAAAGGGGRAWPGQAACASGATTAIGCGSNVTTTDIGPDLGRVLDHAVDDVPVARWTPSKTPMVATDRSTSVTSSSPRQTCTPSSSEDAGQE
jgi:hypothetical protein